ncbi:MAG: Arabinose operon regulatory protein [Candidatus Ordinivivax streblomastigis]|uniref:Arabinose operon regulatory protein n=1 Tax=Candidatus Ordinivivax streblomastigis TaxID=2540710 RepID=A0A5M8NUM1_9BACT|nr:MAG: Arabinose operon regulatory protein [Candidatus Ordinivivax streblomastigis]
MAKIIKNVIAPFNWQSELENRTEIDSIDNDFILFDKPIITSVFDYPFKVDVTTAIICTKGTTCGLVNLKPYTTQAPCLITVLADQILRYDYFSEDFSGLFIVMSKRFSDSLDIHERFPLFLSVRDNPCIPLDEEQLEAMISYFDMMKRTVRVKDNPRRLEIAKHLTLAFFYGLGSEHHKLLNDENKSKHEILVGNFLKHVQAHYREQRDMEFYADKLCLTPKHLSKVVKECSGKSASEWIDSYVILEAKALLKSTNMTIQQISDELNFPSQSFFGKYFKRVGGVSPKEYKKG